MRSADFGKRVVPRMTTIMEGSDGGCYWTCSRCDQVLTTGGMNDHRCGVGSCGKVGHEQLCTCRWYEHQPFVPPADLDPGIRDLVIALNAAGFETTDSGDGKSKFVSAAPGEEIIPFPHVAIVVNKRRLVKESDRLRKWLRASRMPANQQGMAGHWYIEASYDPFVEDGMIFLGFQK